MCKSKSGATAKTDVNHLAGKGQLLVAQTWGKLNEVQIIAVAKSRRLQCRLMLLCMSHAQWYVAEFY